MARDVAASSFVPARLPRNALPGLRRAREDFAESTLILVCEVGQVGTNTENKKQNGKGIKMQIQKSRSRSSKFRPVARKESDPSEAHPQIMKCVVTKNSLYRRQFDFRLQGRSRI